MIDRQDSFRVQAFFAGTFLAAMIAGVTVFLQTFAPPEYRQPKDGVTGFDRTAMQTAVHPEQVASVFADLSRELDSRAPGQTGHGKAAEHLRAAFGNAGLELHELPSTVVFPVVRDAELLESAGQTMDLPVYPLYPNHLQPVATGPEGVSGTLTLVTDELIGAADSFRDMIAVLDCTESLPVGPGAIASRYASLGFSALIVTHRDGVAAIQWSKMGELNAKVPVGFARVAAGPAVLSRVGQRVTLRVRSAFEDVQAPCVMGVMRAPGVATEALLIPVAYDGFSALPTKNPCSFNVVQMALQKQLLNGLTTSRNLLKRDVIFVGVGGEVMAQHTLNDLLRTCGRLGESAKRQYALQQERGGNREALAAVDECLALFDDESFGEDAAVAAEQVAALSESANALFTEQLRHVLKTKVFQQAEKLLQADIAFRKSGENTDSPEFATFRAEKKRHETLNTISAYKLEKLLNTIRADNRPLRPCEDLRKRLNRLRAYHLEREAWYSAALNINEVFSKYDRVVVVQPAMLPPESDKDHETLSFSCGADTAHGEQAGVFRRVLDDARQSLGLTDRVRVNFSGVRHGRRMLSATASIPLQPDAWSKLGFPAFAMVCPQSDYTTYDSPASIPYDQRLAHLRGSLSVLGEVVQRLALGHGRFPVLKQENVPSFRGRVYADSVGMSVVPDYVLPGAVVMAKAKTLSQDPLVGRGYFRKLLTRTDPYGRYDVSLSVGGFGNVFEITPIAAWYDDEGRIRYYKNEGASGQRLYKSINVSGAKLDAPINLVLFRASPVALLDRINPQTLKEYTDAVLLSREGLQPFAKTGNLKADDGIVNFVPPGERFYATLKSGSAENESVQETRAFMLNVPDGFQGREEKEIDGAGYLAQETPILRNVPWEVARSMLYLNGRRLALQTRYDMADEMTQRYHEKAKTYLSESTEAGPSWRDRYRAASKAVIYCTLNHPVIRGNISEAIWGVLWYMGLLVPFVFFFEKLLFGFTDIRKQLVAQGVIFLVVFLLLRLLHPAFEIIRSSAMILLGFVILLISGGITLILSGKFRENMDELRRAQGQVKAAQANKMGIILTAFMLGLNNMHRRKVRTGLTCATLVLLTFVMICFTSVQSDLVDRSTAIAKAAYSGFLIKNEGFAPIQSSEINALERRYGDRYAINPRAMYLGRVDPLSREASVPEIELLYGGKADARRAMARSCLLFTPGDPLRKRFKTLSGASWFDESMVADKQSPVPIMVPTTIADQLGIDSKAVNEGGVPVRMCGFDAEVIAVFHPNELARLEDLDGDNLLPFDVQAIADLKGSGNSVLADRDDPRVPAEDVVLTLRERFHSPVQAGSARVHPRTVSVAVDFGETPYKVARREITSYLEQSGRSTYYGLGRVAFLGKRARERTLTGLVDLLIPLVLAALTVLNTMKGSVYERRDEIFVYNAVGIAPRYVFFMFMAEAAVYSVVGALLGYILSQGTGRVLTALDWTGGLNMNFTSLGTVYASLTISVAVFVSTIFPALSAKNIASPADESGWDLPEAKEDVLAFDLPFTFNYHDRIAFLAFLRTFFSNHGEGSAGPFFSGPPRLGLSDTLDALDENGYVPTLDVRVWLKPFDLGVSQDFSISLPTDEETGEYISRVVMRRTTGTRDAWLRINKAFVARLRQHFLHWRAVPDDMKRDLYEEAKERLEREVIAGDRTDD